MSSIDGRRQARLKSRADRLAQDAQKERAQQRRKPDVKFRSVDLQRIFTLRDRIVSDVFFSHSELVVTMDSLRDLVVQFDRVVPDVDPRVWFETLRTLISVEMTRARIKQFAWTIAANVKALRKGRPVRVWTQQRENEWVAVQVVAVWTAVNRRGQQGCYMKLCVLSGTAAGQTFTKFWSRKQCRLYASALGFSRPFNKRPDAVVFSDMRELTLLRFYIYLDAVRCEERLSFYHLKAPKSSIDFNKVIMGRRRRRKWKCPKAYVHPCHLCAIRYDQCPVGTHPATYVRRYCEECKQDSLFNPATPKVEICVSCTQKANNTPKD